MDKRRALQNDTCPSSYLTHVDELCIISIGINNHKKRGDPMNELVSSDSQPQVRIRINVSRSVKNVYTFDVTVEGTNMTKDEKIILEEILETHDRVIAELKKRYPDAEVA